MSDAPMAVFCSASMREWKNVEALLIPSLLGQTLARPLELHIIDYSGTGLAIKKPVSSEKLTVFFHNAPQPLGFGAAHNHLFQVVKPASPFLIVNPDAFLHEDCLAQMEHRKQNGSALPGFKGTGLVEARQAPFPHPKAVDAESGRTNWASGCCLLVDPVFFEEAQGFDELIWMYCEDVDLSWRSWIARYEVKHASLAQVWHFTGAYFEYPFNNAVPLEELWSARNFLYLAAKFFGESGLKTAQGMLQAELKDKNVISKALTLFEGVKQPALNYHHRWFAGRIPDHAKPFITIMGYNRYHELKVSP